MKILLSWLKEFVEVPGEVKKLATDLTMIGLGVESLVRAGDDWLLDIEVTTNRPDCLSHFGTAREASARYRTPLKMPGVSVRESDSPTADEISIEILDPELCARYCGRVVGNVQVKSSPDWLVRRLESVGLRPINNVADATNYILMELGHPLHAFDLTRLKKKKIVVRRARAGERLRTLDGFDRALAAEHLVIADGERPVALAGIMGGEESEISPDTRTVLLESAWFEPVSIRRTARFFGMRTEASYRFERGADIEMAPVALDRAAALIAELAGGEVLEGVVDVYPAPRPRPPVPLRSSEIVRILGADIAGGEVERILRSLGFKTKIGKKAGWLVTPPSFRLDVTREVDLIEEVARHYGYDRLPARVRRAPPRLERDTRREKELTVAATLIGLGYHEIIPPSMIDPEENGQFSDRPPVVLANPLSQEASALRSSAVPSMIRALRWNLDRDQGDLRLFELGRTYSRSSAGKALPEERRVLTLGLSGRRRLASVYDSEKPIDFYDLKGDLEALMEAFDLEGVRFEPAGCHYYEAGASGRFTARGKTLAVFGELSRDASRNYKLRQAVWLAEVDADELLSAPLRTRAFRPFSKFPSVERDFSLLVPEGTPYWRLKEAIEGAGLEDIRGYRPVDLFRGGSVPEGQYSLLLRVTFQSRERTLTSEEIGEASRRMLAALEPLGVRLREV